MRQWQNAYMYLPRRIKFFLTILLHISWDAGPVLRLLERDLSFIALCSTFRSDPPHCGLKFKNNYNIEKLKCLLQKKNIIIILKLLLSHWNSIHTCTNYVLYHFSILSLLCTYSWQIFWPKNSYAYIEKKSIHFLMFYQLEKIGTVIKLMHRINYFWNIKR